MQPPAHRHQQPALEFSPDTPERHTHAATGMHAHTHTHRLADRAEKGRHGAAALLWQNAVTACHCFSVVQL